MDLAEAMAALEAAGTEQTRKTWRRHGMKDPIFGVLYGAMEKIRKSIGRDQALADALWKTGNGDARVLAAMISVPAKAPLEKWVRDLECSAITDAFSKWAAAPAPGAFERALAWIDADHEWIETAGWSVLGHLALAKGGPDDEAFATLLPRIEREIHGAKNRVRYTMNGLLAGIGLRSEALRLEAVPVAERVGYVEVDHGPTACETPLATTVIAKGWARREARTAAPAKTSAGAATAAKRTTKKTAAKGRNA